MLYKQVKLFKNRAIWLRGMDIPDYRKTVLLAGSGRSGTTWISNIINYDNRYRDMFEPFRPKLVPQVGHFKNKQYLRPDNRQAEYVEPARLLLSGQVSNWWVDQYNHRFYATQRLVKDIRVNLMLPWIKAVFPEIPVVLLLRHPCAVASSKLKLKWEVNMETYLSQTELVEDHLQPYVTEMNCAKNDFERHIFAWCVENYVPLKQLMPGQVHLVFYEDFILEPEAQATRMLDFLGIPYDGEKVKQVISTPSELSRSDSPIRSGGDLTAAWLKHVTPNETRRAVEILHMFGLDQIYGEAPLPINPQWPQLS